MNEEFNRQRLGPAKAIYYASKETWFVTKTTMEFVVLMFKGKGDTSQLGGQLELQKLQDRLVNMDL